MRYTDLLEDATLRKSLRSTLPPTFVMPGLQNDPYKQYRHMVALASVRAKDEEEVPVDDDSPWGERQAVVCYTSADEETLRLANKVMGVGMVPLVTSHSTEPHGVHTVSPVAKFRDLTESQRMRHMLDSLLYPTK